MTRGWSVGALVVAFVVSAPLTSVSLAAMPAAVAQGQQGGARGPGGRGGPAATVAEAERIFDRYMLGQARLVLQLTPDQMVRFAQRFERLQALQRMRQRQRQRRLNELSALGRPGAAAMDDAAVGRLLEALDADLAEADRRVHDARAQLDEILTVRQRARYRTFEARMEREKLVLINRARAEARGRAGGTAPEGESSTPSPGRAGGGGLE